MLGTGFTYRFATWLLLELGWLPDYELFIASCGVLLLIFMVYGGRLTRHLYYREIQADESLHV